MQENLRVAFFPDTYDEIDGVANTSRRFAAFAREQGLSFLIVCGGAENRVETDGSVTKITWRRGKIGFPLDRHHRFDLAVWRHWKSIKKVVQKFDPDVLHITGPSDNGQLGALMAHRLGIPLAASWHTDLHRFAEHRVVARLAFGPKRWRERTGSLVRESCLAAVLRFYRTPQFLFAPNPEIVELLSEKTGKPVYLMRRGVDTTLFSPERRDRESDIFVIGYVGRLTAEKNVRFLAELEQELNTSGPSNFRFSIVGHGAEESWLKAHMRKADFSGLLTGEKLARAYANMDIFVFPSLADTFGNVVLEAFASGVPAIVTNAGGPRFIVKSSETGYIAENAREFASHIRFLAEQPEQLQRMRQAARDQALNASWDGIFKNLYADYECGLRSCAELGKGRLARRQAHTTAQFVDRPDAH